VRTADLPFSKSDDRANRPREARSQIKLNLRCKVVSRLFEKVIPSVFRSRSITTKLLTMSFSRLVRFVPKNNPQLVLIGEPVDGRQDVGLATRSGQSVKVRVFSGSSVIQPGYATHSVEEIGRLLSPVSQQEIGTIRCIGLNVGTENVRREPPLISNSTEPMRGR
jgi:hypothetical protein